MKKISIALLFSLVMVISASAHTLWLESNRYYIEGGGESGSKAYMFFGWGHRLPVDDPVSSEKIKSVKLIEPDGHITPIALGEGRSLHYTPIEYDKEGTYVLLGESNPGYYTMYLDKSQKMHHHVGPMDEIKDAGKVVFSVLAHQYPKSIVISGKSSGAELKPVGNKLEIVPEIEPSKLGIGSRFSFQLLYDGKLLESEDTSYSATYMGHSMEPETFLYTNRRITNGRGDFDISCPGVWFVETEYTVPAPDSLKAKCKNLLYHASLTFAVQEKESSEWEEDESPLAGWAGKWPNNYLLANDPAMDPCYEAVAKVAKGYKADDVKMIFLNMYKTDFGDLEISNDAIVYHDANGKPVARCKYKAAGKETASFSGHEFDWYKFEITSGHGDSDKYKYVIITMVHADSPDSFKHFHMRYGNTSFDDIINNEKLAMWWPTMVAEGTTADKMASEMMKEAPMMATMLPPK
jgi:Zn/Cd-binding protein ZinT/uncharacterized GH25 family protein